jgi:hypothetical protein
MEIGLAIDSKFRWGKRTVVLDQSRQLIQVSVFCTGWGYKLPAWQAFPPSASRLSASHLFWSLTINCSASLYLFFQIAIIMSPLIKFGFQLFSNSRKLCAAWNSQVHRSIFGLVRWTLAKLVLVRDVGVDHMNPRKIGWKHPCAWTKFRFAYGTAIAYTLGCLEPILFIMPCCLIFTSPRHRPQAHCECDQITNAQLYLKEAPASSGGSSRSQ